MEYEKPLMWIYVFVILCQFPWWRFGVADVGVSGPGVGCVLWGMGYL